MNLGINNKHFQSFHIPTPLNRKELSFCESNVDAFRLWTTSLSARPLGDRSAAIFTALHELSSLICTETERFDMLQELHPFIEHVLVILKRISLQRIHRRLKDKLNWLILIFKCV